MSRVVSSIIEGKPAGWAAGGAVTSTNPANLVDVVAEVELASEAEFVAACRSVKLAQPSWAAVPAPVRGRAIQQIGRLVELNKESLSRLVTREIGKPYAEALGEVQEVIDTCNFFLGEGRRLYGQTVPSEMPSKNLFTFRRPVGVAAVVTAGNFPVAVPAWYIVPALLCGNAVVWKPAEYSATCADAFARLILAAGVPPEVFSVVHAEGPTTFAGLDRALTEGLVDKVGFTGSTAVGTQIGELCGRHLQSACLELGGKNPLVVMPDANIDLAVEGALFSGFGTAGQRCTSLGLAIVHNDVASQFIDRYIAAVSEAAIGDPTQAVLFGPMLDERFAERFEATCARMILSHHSTAGSSGLGRISSAKPRSGFVGDPDVGLYEHPTVVTGVKIEDEIANVETFGPIVGVAVFETFDEAVSLATTSGYGLSSAIYTQSPNAAFSFAERVGAGMVSINNSTSGAEAHLPFGGNGKSGNGSRQSGQWVLDQFTRWQALNWDHSGRLQKAQMDTAEVVADLDFRLSD